MARQNTSLILFITCLAYTAFVIYGSLVPLDFVPLSWGDAFERFKHIQRLNLGIGSRADWVANILLFIPLTFLWMAIFHQSNKNFRYFVAFIILIFAIFLCISIEFTQLFFPQRTVSKNDIIAEISGGTLGILAWRIYGQYFNTWLTHWAADKAPAGRYEQVLYLYIAILFGYNLLPLDLTNSPVEIYHKWVDGKVHIIPFFSSMENGLISFLYSIFIDIIIWAPVPFLWILSAKKNPLQAFKWSAFSALLLEFLQLFVYSRVSDSADLITAGAGITIGTFLAHQYCPTSKASITPNEIPPKRTSYQSSLLVISLGLIAGWLTVLLLIFWFPFNFQLETEFIKERLSLLYRAPFSAYYYGTEFRAVTSLLTKLAFFFPLGALLAHLKTGLPRSWPNSLVTTMSTALLIGIAAIIEVGQIALPDKSVDSADILVAIAGGLLGYIVYQFITGEQSTMTRSSRTHPQPVIPIVETMAGHKSAPLPTHSASSREPSTFIKPFNVKYLVPTQLLTMLVAFYFIGKIDTIPYNIKELVGTSNLLERIIFSLALLCAVWPPLFSSQAYFGKQIAGKQYTAIIILQPFILYTLLRLSVPLESIHDIVGYPIINTSEEWEPLLRFIALYSLPSWALIGSTIVLLHPSASRLLSWFFIGILVILSWHWIVVRSAATDNLTELLRNGGNWQSTLWLTSWLICFTSSLLAVLKLIRGHHKHWLFSLLTIVSAFPLSYWMLNQGLEIVIIKYGQVFSGLQFLLSPGRDNLVAEQDLMLRYFLAYFALLSGMGWLGVSAIPNKPASTYGRATPNP